MNYVKYLTFLLVGIFLTIIYFIPNKAEILNSYAVTIYMKTNIGRESLRNQLHAECYFTGEYLQLNKGFTVDMFDLEHKYCWTAADRSLEYIQQGQFSIAF